MTERQCLSVLPFCVQEEKSLRLRAEVRFKELVNSMEGGAG